MIKLPLEFEMGNVKDKCVEQVREHVYEQLLVQVQRVVVGTVRRQVWDRVVWQARGKVYEKITFGV